MTDKKKLIEGGWNIYRRMFVPNAAPDFLVNELRQAYFMGAATLFAGMISALDPGTTETEKDMKLMEALQAEVDEFGRTLDKKVFGKEQH